MANSILLGIGGLARGVRVPLTAAETRIGRHSENELAIPDSSVSRQHCMIVRRGDQFYISDLDSNNGTVVNGQLLTGEQLLQHGDKIEVGESLIRFVEHEDTADSAEKRKSEGSWTGSATVVLDRAEVRRMASTGIIDIPKLDERLKASLQALLDIGRLITSSQGIASLQASLFQSMAEVIPADAGVIVLLGYSDSEPWLIYPWERSGKRGKEAQFSRSVVSRVIEEQSAVLMAGDAPVQGEYAESVVLRQIQSVLCVPLCIREQAHGAIYLETSDPAQPFDEDHLRLLTSISGYAALAFDQARRLEQLQAENERLRSEVQLRHAMIGDSPRMRDVYERMRKVAGSEATVLITGESGTGKELAARALHLNSPRSNGPFEAINCALLRNELLESELFGHEKGSFTGAVSQKRGKIELAEGGTLFLDEVGELGLGPQSMLLRVLQEKEFTRVGGLRTLRANVRLVAATNRDLEDLVKQKQFRQDLYYRLNVVCLQLPSLRERKQDIVPLAEYFLRRSAQRNKRSITGISPAARAALLEYDWPGNVRQLENVMEHAVVFGSTDEILPEDLPDIILNDSRSARTYAGNYHIAVRQAREQIVLNAIRAAGNDFPKAANSLGIHVSNLHRLVRELNLRNRLAGTST